MKTAFLFAGQGSQIVGMGKDFYEKCSASKRLMDSLNCDYDIRKLCFEGPQEILNDTAYAQSAIAAVSLMIFEGVRAAGILPDVCAGLSLGEYSALSCAGAMDPQTVIDIVRQRGILMANALPEGTTGMSAVLGLEAETILEICHEIEKKGMVLEIANYNCPGQIVITGQKEALEQAEPLLLEKGARRVLPLNVSGAFHSSLLTKASEQLEDVLKKAKLSLPGISVYHNVDAQPGNYTSIQELIEILKKQICHSVRFEQTIRNMIIDGVDTFVEIGPGKTLSGFVRKVNKEVKVYTINTHEDLERMSQTWNK
ncbi:ACP S-malonyltransferase [uncultured Faecalicoccus sp.]|uniref:ACP S-malonyltransferase n=1 Tax=uncultured Faecalicoccus sp. TaxID=1971760 RepID=UPI002630027C|nr:ACP S-malonyltransferase [uncultured Faecalicoccus sp.]